MSSHLVLASITTTLTDFVGRHGAYAVFIIMAVDAVLPVGGELTMLYAGALAAGAISSHHPVLFGHTLHTGLESYIVLALAGTLGYLLGSLIGWAIGRWGGRPLPLRVPTGVQAPVMLRGAPFGDDAVSPSRSGRSAARPPRRPGLSRPAPPMTGCR
jgi:membrane protein DedA with SNARE-associated domain